MERLTMHTPDNFGYAEHQLKPGVDEQDAVSRLAAYENTGLEPEEITANYQVLANIAGAIKSVGIDRLVELAEADKDGRLAVLPCKVGNAVYQIFTTNGERRIASYRMSSIDVMLTRKNEFGKTVFLTREAAEAALKAGDTP